MRIRPARMAFCRVLSFNPSFLGTSASLASAARSSSICATTLSTSTAAPRVTRGAKSLRSLLPIQLHRSLHADGCHAKSPDDIALLGITAFAELTGDHPKGCDIFLTMGKHRHVPVEIRYAAILFLKRQFAGDVGHASRKHRQMKLGHGTVSPDEGKKKTELPSPSHHPRILSIRPRSARRHPAFLVRRIDLANNFAITPLQSHPSEIRRSEIEPQPECYT